MIIKGLRQDRGWSQEQLAEISGLSLRTIQRLEGSSKVSAETLASLSGAFGMEAVDLEREMAMNKTSSEWKRRPAWVRSMFFGSGRIKMDRQQHKKVEIFAIVSGIMFVTSGVLAELELFVPAKSTAMLLICGSLLILGAYLTSVSVRVGNEHSVWPWVDSSN